MPDTHEIAQLLLDIKAIQINTKDQFVYSSGIQSPIYCDNRLILSYPDKRQIITKAFAAVISQHGIECDVIAGTATAGIAHAAWLAHELNKPMIYVRSQAKQHGQKNQIEGHLKPKQRVLVIEDLVSTGNSVLNAAQAIQDQGGIVQHALAIFHYQMSAATKNFQAHQIELHCLSCFSALIELLANNDSCPPETRQVLQDWHRRSQ